MRLRFIDIFLFFMNFFPTFPFNCKCQLFLHDFMQISENFWRFAPFADFFSAILCYKRKNFRRIAPFQRCHEDFYLCRQEKTERNLACFCLRRGENWNLLPKYLPLFKGGGSYIAEIGNLHIFMAENGNIA